jgi:hypothetical protein
MFAKSTLSKANPPDFTFWLWQVMQYVSTIWRSDIAAAGVAAFVAGRC